ncbi:MAG TPA: agmatine deiminase family protein [Lentimicrobium sp.]|nr:agmatine deiminase family protein [Lentimicrobium sp.]
MEFTLRRILFFCIILSFSGSVLSQNTKSVSVLTHQMTPDEYTRQNEIGRNFVQTDPPTGDITSMAEFDRAIGAVIAYPFGIPMNLIREMAKDAVVTTLVADVAAQNTVINLYTQARVNLNNCEFMIIPTNSYWTRDYGPWYVTYGNNQIGIIDFPYNRPRPQDDDAPKLMAQNLGIPWFGMPVSHTGGNYMTDGYGYASSTTIVYTENTSMTPAEINQHMQNYLGIDDYSVLEDPNNTYIDHIDCWGKYLAPDKVLIRSVPASHPQYDEIEATAAYYANKISMYGTPYKVYRVFTPQNQPYTNSFILNDKVFVPIMNSQYDNDALQVYKDAMPGYKVFGILGQPTTPWESTDALHCRAHEMADLQMLYLKHIPRTGNQPIQNSYNFVAYAHTFGGQQVIADSMLMYYRVNPNPVTPYTVIPLNNTMGDAWSATLTAPAEGSTVEYYIFAKDETGRREFQPFIGKADAFKFYIGNKLDAQVGVNPSAVDFTAMKDTRDTTNLTINSTGAISVNYSIEGITDVNDTLNFTLNNSPGMTVWSSNTLTELNWTTFAVTATGNVKNVVLDYAWMSDEFYEEGSIWIQSPSGTSYRAGYQQLDGTYRVICPAFEGEPLNGNWKVWMEDSHGDGGHQATNVRVQLIADNPQSNWLSIGSPNGNIAPGSNTHIQLIANAQGLNIGTYNGLVKVYSNDPDQPVIEVPLTLNVTINTAADQGLYTDKIEVYPNPFVNELNLTFNLVNKSEVLIEIYNTNGMLVYSSKQSIGMGEQQLTIPSNDLPEGLYLLKITNGENQNNFKLIKGK